MPTGAGTSPAGAYGVGTAPLDAVLPSTKVLPGDQGKQFNSRKISTDSTTQGQYVFDANGAVVGDKDVRQLVILAIRTLQGSSVIRPLGMTALPRKITADFSQKMTANVNAALADLVKANMIQIDNISVVESEGGRTATRIQITDLTTKRQFGLSI